MLRAMASCVASLVLFGCTQVPPDGPISVQEAIERIHQLDGQTVEVHGWLGHCAGYDCALYISKDDAETVAYGDWESDQWLEAMDRRLSIGANKSFDHRAAPFQFQRVAIKGKIDATCRGMFYVCTDRVPDIVPHSIAEI
ncbi:hypothetical protein [Alterisphingorhabdus coralli]|uniref:Lipoprotein n=1 Tax=Alterisphingorhabdus coralli TaxID=3071408 RepID=A0AA97F672_9SPHN|nr:hypothetical protein [Parasphingorhabdus sp. SCSIO 66989]WOE74196.1 hypothetical protein RB602_10050 [Parasphingorhabdus sp. SCSIO 66989]